MKFLFISTAPFGWMRVGLLKAVGSNRSVRKIVEIIVGKFDAEFLSI